MTTSPKWNCVPAREGLMVCHPETSEAFFLPSIEADDTPLRQPWLSLSLTADEIAELRANVHLGPVVATCYGPPEPEQEKESNQDFALAAVVEASGNATWSLAAVADGVSTRTFWPERSARLACLSAYKTIRALIKNGSLEEQEFLEQIRAVLCKDLRAALAADREILATLDLTPFGWDPAVYRDHKKTDDYWYNTTLLICALGPAWGFLLWTGDGAIRIVKTDGTCEEERTVLETSESLTIEQFVSLRVTPNQFRAARISYPDDAVGAVEVYLSTDGVDRSLKMNDNRWTYRTLDLSDAPAARRQLAAIYGSPKHEKDNYSVAKLSWSNAGSGALPGEPRARGSRARQRAVSRAVPAPKPSERREAQPQPVRQVPPVAETTGRSRSSYQPLIDMALVLVCALFYASLGNLLSLLLPRAAPSPQAKSPSRKVPVAGEPRQVGSPASPRMAATLGPGAAWPHPRRPAARALAEEFNFAPYELASPQRQQDIDNARANSDLDELCEYWAQIMQAHPRLHYSVVAYSDRQAPGLPRDCEKLVAIALKRASYVAGRLASRPGIAGMPPLDVRQRVCEAPPGVHDITSPDARRIVVSISKVENCKCDKLAEWTQK